MDDFAAASPQAKRELAWNLGCTKDPAALDAVYQWWQAEADKATGSQDQNQLLQDAHTVSRLLLEAGDPRGIDPWVAYTRFKYPRTVQGVYDHRHGASD